LHRGNGKRKITLKSAQATEKKLIKRREKETCRKEEGSGRRAREHQRSSTSILKNTVILSPVTLKTHGRPRRKKKPQNPWQQ